MRQAGHSLRTPEEIPGAQQPFRFDGPTYEPERDQARLASQANKVFAFMKCGQWHTLREIAEGTGAPEASISARLRDLRKERFGGHTVQRRYLYDGLFEYRLKVSK